MLAQPLHVNCSALALSDLETALWLVLGIDKQVLYLLVVDLQHAELDLELDIVCLVSSDSFEYFIACNWHNSFVRTVANHRVTLARPCLPIGEQAAVVSIPCIVEDLLAKGFVHDLLIGVVRTCLWNHVPVLLRVELIMRPKTVVERVGLLLACDCVHQHCGGSILQSAMSTLVKDLPSARTAVLLLLSPSH